MRIIKLLQNFKPTINIKQYGSKNRNHDHFSQITTYYRPHTSLMTVLESILHYVRTITMLVMIIHFLIIRDHD